MLSMILYHTVWDLVNLFHVSLPWYHSQSAFLWQQSICWGIYPALRFLLIIRPQTT